MTLAQIGYAEQQCTGLNYPSVALRMEIWRDDAGAGVDAVNNRETLRGKVMLIRRGTGGTTTRNTNGNCAASASGALDTVAGNDTIWASGGISYDFQVANGHGANGYAQMLWEGDFVVEHDANGSKTFTFAAAWDSPSGDILGDTSVSGSVALPPIVQAPTAPTSVSAVRISDTSATVSWAQANPGNGQPTSNKIQQRVNGGAWTDVATVSVTTSATVATSGNQKIEYRVRASNSAGNSAYSAASAAIYTSPAAPTGVSAVKDASLNIDISWTPQVAYAEHEHVIEHSTDNGATWGDLDTVAAGTSTYEHVAPNPAETHRYRVRARSTSGALTSAWAESSTVQLLAAPNKPTLPDLPDYTAKEYPFVVPWSHNPVDTTAQTAYEFSRSTDGGSSWTSSGKVTATAQEFSIAGGTYAANVAVLVRVRTWGQATSGGSDGTGASPWSDSQSVTFKSAPVATVASPADASTYEQADLVVSLGFAQAEGATFAQATVVLSDAGGDLETVVSGSLSGIAFATSVENGETYTISVVLRDSNGVQSAEATADFEVEYTAPVAAEVAITYLEALGWAQIELTFPEPGVDEVEAVALTITRTIEGLAEDVVITYPVSGDPVTILDTIPTIRGVNAYRVRTLSADGAVRDVAESLETNERRWAFLSSGSGFSDVVSFFGDLQVSVKPGRASALVAAAGRRKPIALFGVQTSLVVSGSATLIGGEGSSRQEVEAFLLTAEQTCYRDPSGRRIFGRATGSVAASSDAVGGFSFEVTEAS